jgi:hypothetical protein
MALTQISTQGIKDGTITNADINASAAIAGTKISPSFTSNIDITNTLPKISLVDTDNNDDFDIKNQNGIFIIADVTDSADRLTIASNGQFNLYGNVDISNGLDVTGAITGTGDLTIDTNTLHVDSSNNRVGIGTTSPDGKLSVTGNIVCSSGTVRSNSGFSSDTDLILNADENADGSNSIIFKEGGTERARFKHDGDLLLTRTTAGSGATETLLISGNYGSGSSQALVASAAFRIYTGGTNERLRIKSDGNVGIGTTSPSDKLHVRGASAAFTTFILDNATNSSSPYKITFGDQGQVNHLAVANREMTFGTNNAEKMRIDSSGRLFLGLTTLQYPKKLNIQGESGSIIHLNNYNTTTYAANTSTAIEFNVNTGNTGNQTGACELRAFKENGTNGDNARALSFYTGVNGGSPTERMRITSNGFSKHTSDSGNYVSSTGNYHEFRSNSGNNPNTIFFHNGVGNTQFGIKIQTANEQNDTSHHFIDCREGGSATRRFIVYANGNVQNSNNSYGQLSDIKLKENVVDSNSQWNDIKQLKVRNFNFKNDNTNLKQIGLIAQEAEIVCPSLVFESQDQEEDAETGEIKDKGTTTKSVKYSVLYMKAIKCLQEAMARIEALETKVAALKAA